MIGRGSDPLSGGAMASRLHGLRLLSVSAACAACLWEGLFDPRKHALAEGD